MRPFFAAAALACSTTLASATVIRFSNPNPNNYWVQTTMLAHGFGLDITQPASQSGAFSPITIDWERQYPAGSNDLTTSNVYCQPSVRLTTVALQVTNIFPDPVTFYVPRDFPAGAVVGPGLNWSSSATLAWHFGFQQANWIVGNSFTMGLQLTLADGIHYGYANFILDPSEYDPTSWGYESDPGVPLTVPAPVGSSVLLIATSALLRRRRGSRHEPTTSGHPIGPEECSNE